MSKLEDCWPDSTDKEAWLAAMSLWHDAVNEGKREPDLSKIEALHYTGEGESKEWVNLSDYFDYPLDHNGEVDIAPDQDWGRTCSIFGQGFIWGTIRPFHKNRWLAEKWVPGSKWQYWNVDRSEWMNVSDTPMGCWGIDLFNYYLDLKFRPHPEKEPSLYEWYLDNKGDES